ncbi:GNAT family N-acetyltransferase [Streptomyces sp. NPDC052013]|uniref:GNAT family N-acetyltransferase n=1 Tax=Streptomyces sp. NPDC052013 TaxID=3365679 RepID=UPI0037D5AD02
MEASVWAAGVRLAGGGQVRVMEPDDQPKVLALVRADWLPGQPEPDPQLLTGQPRPGLTGAATLVLTGIDSGDRVRGVVHCAVRTSDGVGLIGWLHAREDFEALAVLIAAARANLGPARTLYAGTGPTQLPETLTSALSGIAERRRPATTRALCAAGFTPATSRRYYHHALTSTPTRPLFPLPEIRPLTDPPGVQLTLTETDGSPLATAVLHTSGGDHWQLWHLAVHAGHRRRGIGSHLLAQCLHLAHSRGATSLAAHIDEDDTAAARLLTVGGFTEVDTLTIHHRRP